MDRNNTKVKITNYFSKTTPKNEKSLDHVPETSKTPAASGPSSVYKNLALAGLEENNIEQPVEQHTLQGNEERQSIPYKPNQPRDNNFSMAAFWKTKTCF